MLSLKALILANPATARGVIEASLPPVKTISIYPSLIFKNPSPIAFVAAAQAVTTLPQYPLASKSIATVPAAILINAIGIKYGETLLGPFSFNTFSQFEIVSIPPIPLAKITPVLSLSKSLRFESSKACLVAILANFTKRSLNFKSRLL